MQSDPASSKSTTEKCSEKQDGLSGDESCQTKRQHTRKKGGDAAEDVCAHPDVETRDGPMPWLSALPNNGGGYDGDEPSPPALPLTRRTCPLRARGWFASHRVMTVSLKRSAARRSQQRLMRGA